MKWLRKLLRKEKKRDAFYDELNRRVRTLEEWIELNKTLAPKLDLQYWEMVIKLELYREIETLYRERFKEWQ